MLLMHHCITFAQEPGESEILCTLINISLSNKVKQCFQYNEGIKKISLFSMWFVASKAFYRKEPFVILWYKGRRTWFDFSRPYRFWVIAINDSWRLEAPQLLNVTSNCLTNMKYRKPVLGYLQLEKNFFFEFKHTRVRIRFSVFSTLHLDKKKVWEKGPSLTGPSKTLDWNLLGTRGINWFSTRNECQETFCYPIPLGTWKRKIYQKKTVNFKPSKDWNKSIPILKYVKICSYRLSEGIDTSEFFFGPMECKCRNNKSHQIRWSNLCRHCIRCQTFKHHLTNCLQS